MVAIRARFDGKVLIPEEPVELPRDRTLIVHVQTETAGNRDASFLRPLLFPSDPEAAKRLISDVESGLENT